MNESGAVVAEAEAQTMSRRLWILAANAIPVFGVLLFGWQALPLLVFYWIENVVIGAFNLPKILISGLTKPMPQPVFGVVLLPFFVIHYGMFCFVHGVFVFAMFTFNDLIRNGVEPQGDSFSLLGRVGAILGGDRDLMWGAAALVIVHAARFAFFWVRGAQWRDRDPARQMLEPYGRIVVMHLTIFGATIGVIALGQPMIAVLVLALLKTALELGLPQFRVASPNMQAR